MCRIRDSFTKPLNLAQNQVGIGGPDKCDCWIADSEAPQEAAHYDRIYEIIGSYGRFEGRRKTLLVQSSPDPSRDNASLGLLNARATLGGQQPARMELIYRTSFDVFAEKLQRSGASRPHDEDQQGYEQEELLASERRSDVTGYERGLPSRREVATIRS